MTSPGPLVGGCPAGRALTYPRSIRKQCGYGARLTGADRYTTFTVRSLGTPSVGLKPRHARGFLLLSVHRQAPDQAASAALVSWS
jgi:hypothetical protein